MKIDLGSAPTGPLAGVKVIDLSTIVSGPLCAQILGDLGADVVKFEPPSGDSARYLGIEGQPAMAGIFVQMNRNKRSVALDLKKDAGRNAFLELAAQADIVVENFRPGVSDRLGIGFEVARKRNPGLIWVAISGFGPDGPYRDQPAYDMVIQGMSGFAKVLGDDENPQLISNLIADKTSGLTACYSVVAALYAREKNGGQGQRVDVPMIDAVGAFLHADGFAPNTYGPVPRNVVLEKLMYRAWETADGHVALIVVEDKHFQALCRVLEREDLIDDERCATLLARITNGEEVFGILEQEIAKFTTEELISRARKHGTPLGPVHDVASFMEDPQVKANEIVFELEDPVHGTMKLFGSPPRFESTPTSVRYPPPHLGAHTQAVLEEAGIASPEPDDE